MSSSSANVFSELRAILQQKELSWRDFITQLNAQMSLIDPDDRQIVRDRYGAYFEQEVSRRFAVHERTITFFETLERTEPLHRTLARHLEVKYDYSRMKKRVLARCEAHWASHSISHITMVSLLELGARHTKKLTALIYAHGPARIEHLVFSLEHELGHTKEPLLTTMLDALYDVPNPNALHALTWIQRFSANDVLQAHVYTAMITHIPRYTALTDLIISEDWRRPEQLVYILDRLPPSLERLSISLSRCTSLNDPFFKALLAPHSTEDTPHLLDRILDHSGLSTLQGLRIGGLSDEAIAYAGLHPAIARLTHVTLSWARRADIFNGWQGASDLHHQLAHPKQDDDIAQNYRLVEELELGAVEPCTFEMLHALMCDAQGAPRIFPFLKRLILRHTDTRSLNLLWHHGPACFPRLNVLLALTCEKDQHINATIDHAVFPAWHSLTELHIETRSEASQHMLTQLLITTSPVLASLHTLRLQELTDEGYQIAFSHLSDACPALRLLRLAITDRQRGLSVFTYLKTSGMLDTLERLDFYISKYTGSNAPIPALREWLAHVQDTSLPTMLRCMILSHLLENTDKRHLLKKFGPALGMTLPRSASRTRLVEIILKSLPGDTHHYHKIAHGMAQQGYVELSPQTSEDA